MIRPFLRTLGCMLLLVPLLVTLPAQAACSSWRSPQKVWLNEYFFGSGANAPPNYLELYSTSNTYAAQWHGSYVEVYSAANTKTTYTFTAATATACTIANKTWITYNVLGGLRQQNALVILRDPGGAAIDAFVFDNTAPPAPWTSASNNWAPSHTTGCPALDTALNNQAALATTRPFNDANMLVLASYGNKDFSRYPDGSTPWNDTTYTGAGTSYTQCVSNNANFTKTVDNATPTPGSTVTFTLSIANTSGSALTGIVLDDYLPNYPVTGAPTYISATPVNSSDTVVTTGTYSTVDPNNTTIPNPTVTAQKITWSPAAIAAGNTAKLYIKMQVPANATTGYTYTNTAQTTAGLDPSQTDFANITVGSLNVGSFVITVDTGSASTCTPALLGPKLTITAMTGPNGTGVVNTAYSGSAVYLSASSASPKWYNSAGTQITVSPVPAGSFVNGVATFYLTDATPETITVSALDATTYAPEAMQGSSGNITFTSGSSGMELTDGETLTPGSAWRLVNPTYGVVAGRPHKVRATLSSCGVTATTRTGSYSGTIGYIIDGTNHPVGATAPTISTTATCPGAIAPPSAITLAFASGVADFYLCTSDVGKFALNLTLSLTSPSASVSGASSNFTVRPFVVTASGFPASLPLAGGSFTGTVNAWRWLSSADTDSNGVPDVTVTPTIIATGNPGLTPRFSGTTNNAGVVSTSIAMVAPTACPASPCACTLSPTTLTLTGGTATPSLSYTEAGSIKIGGGDAAKLYAATNYLSATGLNVPILSDTVRLIPAYFDTARTDTCPPTFVYSRQPFTVRVTAKNALGSTTCGYDGAAGTAKAVTLTDGNALTEGTLISPSVPSVLFSGGVASATPKYSFTSSTTPPQTILLRATEDSPGGDGVSSNVSAITYPTHTEKSLEVRSGRLRLENAFGAEVLPLSIPAYVEYWDGTGSRWKQNTDDDCTGFLASDLAFDFPASSSNLLVACNTAVTDISGSSPSFKINLAAPNPGRAGWADITMNLDSAANGSRCTSVGAAGAASTTANRPWLQYNWIGSGAANPTARADFGIYNQLGKSNRIIYRREVR